MSREPDATAHVRSMSDDALAILNLTVRLTVGDKAEPRPGQVLLTQQTAAALDRRKHAAAVAPTGSGKSYSLGAPAFERAALFDERVMISTESLTLQKQIQEKDFPRLAEATKQLYGKEVTFAVLKGTSNYIDPRQLTATAALMTGAADMKRKTSEWLDLIFKAKPNPEIVAALDGADFALLKQLVMWCFGQYENEDAAGDRHSCPLKVTEAEWRHVSASSAEAAGADDHWLFPKAVAAKERASVADIVIVNHTLLAIQAAKGINIVLGNSTYGDFDHLLIDEAHALPSEVRKQGASVISGGVLMSLIYKVEKLAANAARWRTSGEVLADALDRELRGFLSGAPQKKVEKDDDPLGDVGLMLTEWVKDGQKLIKPASESSAVRTMLDGKRTLQRCDELLAAISSVSKFRAGDARWVDVPEPMSGSTARRSWAAANASPVNVGQKLLNNLYVLTDPLTEEKFELGVAAVSATLPEGFAFQAGLAAQVVEYESPFADAYRESCLFIPNGVPHMMNLTVPGYNGKRKFDTSAHQKWASEMARRLIEANGGSALLLAASARSGKFYVEQLRRQFPGLTIHSQWDGPTATSSVDDWKSDPSSVLVGTRSLMTGLDAPGETNTLVILDRIPRSPSNAQDDARAEDLMSRGIDKFTAERIVYAGDAALLEAQAIGRLIRSASDRGMAAVLDPRLLKYTRASFPGYAEPTRLAYMKPLASFGVKLSDEDKALGWLRARRGALVAA
jgi:ATP-dependent DNA helicase DinG